MVSADIFPAYSHWPFTCITVQHRLQRKHTLTTTRKSNHFLGEQNRQNWYFLNQHEYNFLNDYQTIKSWKSKLKLELQSFISFKPCKQNIIQTWVTSFSFTKRVGSVACGHITYTDLCTRIAANTTYRILMLTKHIYPNKVHTQMVKMLVVT